MDMKYFKPNEKIGLQGDCKSCAICLQDYEEGDKLMILKCGHGFHSAGCLLHWLTIRKTCPICRVPTDGSDNEEIQHEHLFDSLELSDDEILQDLSDLIGLSDESYSTVSSDSLVSFSSSSSTGRVRAASSSLSSNSSYTSSDTSSSLTYLTVDTSTHSMNVSQQ